MLLSNFSLPVKFYSFRGGNEKFTVIGAGSLFAQSRPPRPTLSRLRRSSCGFATRVSHLAHKSQTRACSQAIISPALTQWLVPRSLVICVSPSNIAAVFLVSPVPSGIPRTVLIGFPLSIVSGISLTSFKLPMVKQCVEPGLQRYFFLTAFRPYTGKSNWNDSYGHLLKYLNNMNIPTHWDRRHDWEVTSVFCFVKCPHEGLQRLASTWPNTILG